jgi:hypothetical protein
MSTVKNRDSLSNLTNRAQLLEHDKRRMVGDLDPYAQTLRKQRYQTYKDPDAYPANSRETRLQGPERTPPRNFLGTSLRRPLNPL